MIAVGWTQPTWMILVLLLTLLIPLTGYTDDLNEDMIKAAYKGEIATVKALLAKGAEVNAKLKDSRWTALEYSEQVAGALPLSAIFLF